MAMATITIEKLCNSGCNVVVNASDYASISLEKFASIIVKSNGHLTIKNCDTVSSITLEKLASIGRGHITLDFTE